MKQECRNSTEIPKKLVEKLRKKCSGTFDNQNMLSVKIGISVTTLNQILTGKLKRIQPRTHKQILEFCND